MTANSGFFLDLYESYSAEIGDLRTDSESKIVLQQRLDEMRPSFGSLLPMMECNPEMVSAHFYGAFVFVSTTAVRGALRMHPDDMDFPAWSDVEKTLTIAVWAVPLVRASLAEACGGRFLVIAAGLEYLRLIDSRDSAEEEHDQTEPGSIDGEEADGEPEDLSEAGNEWLSSQGFDSTR